MVRALLAAVVLMAITAIGNTTNVASAATMTVQPPSAETWLVTAVGRGAGYHFLRNASTNGLGSGGTAAELGGAGASKIVLTNSEYMVIENSGGGARDAGYRGVKL